MRLPLFAAGLLLALAATPRTAAAQCGGESVRIYLNPPQAHYYYPVPQQYPHYPRTHYYDAPHHFTPPQHHGHRRHHR